MQSSGMPDVMGSWIMYVVFNFVYIEGHQYKNSFYQRLRFFTLAVHKYKRHC